MTSIAPVATRPRVETDKPGGKPAKPAATRERHFYFVLIPNFTMIAFATAIEPLRIANRMSGQQAYRWSLVSLDGEHSIDFF